MSFGERAIDPEAFPYLEHWLWLRGREHGADASLPCEEEEGNAPEIARIRRQFRAVERQPSLILRDDTLGGRDAVGWEDAPEGEFLSAAAMPSAGDPFCILGMIDDSIAPLHPALTVTAPAGLASRIAAAWMMGASRSAEIGRALSIGREIRGVDIDPLLAQAAAGTDENSIMRAAGLHDAARGPLHAGGRRGGHGAAVAGLMAGNVPEDPVGRERPLIAVSLPPEVTRSTDGTFLPWFVHAGLIFILRRAAALVRALEGEDPVRPLRPPLVVNLSYGVMAGRKDGHGELPRLMQAVAEGRNLPAPLARDRARIGEMRIVLPMGNHRLSRLRARLAPRSCPDGARVWWEVPPDDSSPNYLEIWASEGDDPLPLAITPPGGPEIEVPPGASDGWAREITLDGDHLLLVYRGMRTAPGGGRAGGPPRRVVTLALPPTAPDRAVRRDARGHPGLWAIRSLTDAPLDLFVQRDDALDGFDTGRRQSRLWHPDYVVRKDDGRLREIDHPTDTCPIRREGTANAYATTNGDAVVRAAARIGSPRGPAPYSGLGGDGIAPTSGNPARRAEGDRGAISDRSPIRPGIPAAGAHAGASVHISGTSAAAPQVARVLATELARRMGAERRGEEPSSHPEARADESSADRERT